MQRQKTFTPTMVLGQEGSLPRSSIPLAKQSTVNLDSNASIFQEVKVNPAVCRKTLQEIEELRLFEDEVFLKDTNVEEPKEIIGKEKAFLALGQTFQSI